MLAPVVCDTVRQRKKTVMGSVSSVWFVLFVWLNQTKRIQQSTQMNQINQTNPTSPACLAPLSCVVSQTCKPSMFCCVEIELPPPAGALLPKLRSVTANNLRFD